MLKVLTFLSGSKILQVWLEMVGNFTKNTVRVTVLRPYDTTLVTFKEFQIRFKYTTKNPYFKTFSSKSVGN